VFLGAESPRRTGNGWKNVEENKVQSANAQVSNSVIFRIKCRAQDNDTKNDAEESSDQRKLKCQILPKSESSVELRIYLKSKTSVI
jgi:hypothetical protein